MSKQSNDVLNKGPIYRNIHNLMIKDPQVLQGIKSGNQEYIDSLLKMYGILMPDIDDRQVIINLANARESLEQQAEREKQAKEAAEFEKNKTKQEYADNVRKVMSLDPEARLVYAAGTAAAEGAHGLGKAIPAKGNHMAQAILESNRNHSPKQEALYGPSMSEKAAALTAHGTAAKGEAAGAIFNALGNALDTVLGIQRQEGQALRQLEMTPYNAELGLPGDYWQALSQREKRAQKPFDK